MHMRTNQKKEKGLRRVGQKEGEIDAVEGRLRKVRVRRSRLILPAVCAILLCNITAAGAEDVNGIDEIN
jgi:hypothetical protein